MVVFPEHKDFHPLSITVAVVMAAGKGTRMKSDLPKVLVPVRGRPMIEFVLDALEAAGIDKTVVVIGYRGDDVRAALAHRKNVVYAVQAEQRGTGHAVMSAREHLTEHDGAVVVVAGDSPMMQSDSLKTLLSEFAASRPACILGTATKGDPRGLGRIVRDHDGNFAGIVEEKDASLEEKRIREVNLSCYVFNCRDLLEALNEIRADNSQGEYYITDCPAVILKAGKKVQAMNILKPCEALSINDRDELTAVERAMHELGMDQHER